MPSIYDLKPRFQNLLRPLIGRLALLGVTANMVTLSAVALSLAVGLLLLLSGRWRLVLLLLPGCLLIRMALNAIDGMMARELKMKTNLGAVLNELGDVISDIALYLPLAVIYEPARWPVAAFSFGAALTEFCGVLGQAVGGERRYDGPMGKSDRALLVGLLGLVTVTFPESFALWPVVFAIAAALTVLTCWNRISRVLRQLEIQP